MSSFSKPPIKRLDAKQDRHIHRDGLFRHGKGLEPHLLVKIWKVTPNLSVTIP